MLFEAGLRQVVRLVGRILLLVMATLAGATAALAQPPSPVGPPPVLPNIDARGVNLTTGALVTGARDVGIGPADHHGLSLSRQWTSGGWRIAGLPTMSGSTSYPIVSFGGGSVPFKPNGSGGYQAIYQDGSTLSSDRTTFTASDGTQVIFSTDLYTDYSVETNIGYGVVTIYTDGTRQVFHYNKQSYNLGPQLPEYCLNTQNPPSDCYNLSAQWQYYFIRRLSSITNSNGYEIKLHYASNVPTFEDMGSWWTMTQATALNNAVEYCSPVADTCSYANSWPQANYAGGGDTSVSDALGRTTSYSYTTQGQLSGIQPPGLSANVVSYGYTSGKVTSATVAGGTWTYAYPSSTQTTVTDPFSNVTTINYSSNLLVTSVVADGKTTSYSYCPSGQSTCPEDLLNEVTLPEGNKVTYVYDARGNVTSTTATPKAGSSEPPIATTAVYPSSCANVMTCNKPTSTTDARGKTTDYSWNATHGGLDWIKYPADSNGVRPETHNTYLGVQAWLKDASGSVVLYPDVVYILLQSAQCRTSAWPCANADRRETNLSYYGGPTATNLGVASVTQQTGDGSISSTTSLAYDNYGQLLTSDGPLAADTVRVRYNLAGQVVGQVASDPDDTGPAKYPATRYSYNSAGQVYLVETGTVNGFSDTDWAAFSATGNSLTEFDSYGRPKRQKLREGTTDKQVVDTVYDTAGRVQCSMVRMDPSNWSSYPSSCNPTQTTAFHGPDRVAYNHYDALGRVWKTTSAYGTASATDKVITFTNNGKVATVLDGEHHLTSYVYDGHDRLQKTFYPHPSTIDTSSTTDYVQFTYDLGNNLTALRTRRDETITYTYDDLGRLVTKTVPERSGLDSSLTKDVYYGYDLFGNLAYARFDSATGSGITNAYDSLGRLTSSTDNIDGVSRTLSHQYDVAGNRTDLTYPDGNFARYIRRGSGALYSININSVNGLIYQKYLPNGQLDRVERWSTATSSWAQSTSYTFDGISQMTSFTQDLLNTNGDTTATFSYSPSGQTSSSTRSSESFAYSGGANVGRSYTPNGLNQYGNVDGKSFTYDANGNLTSDGPGTSDHSYVYDVENRLVSKSGGSTATLKYDPLGRLHEVVGSTAGTIRFLYDGDDLVAEYNGSNAMLRRYVHGEGAGDDPLVGFEGSTVSDSARRYLYADERGSIVARTNSSGAIQEYLRYDDYGQLDGTAASRFQYTGQAWLKDVDLYYYKARFYSPTHGRFMQTDPIGYGDGLNMYAYVGNDPVNGVDPRGLCEEAGAFVTQDCTVTVTRGGCSSFFNRCIDASAFFSWLRWIAPPIDYYVFPLVPVSGGGGDSGPDDPKTPQNGPLKRIACGVANAIFSKDPNARGTLQIGPAITGKIPILGGVAAGGGLAIDRGGNVALYGYGGKLIGTGLGGAVGLSIQVSNAKGVSNLSGPFAVSSVTAGDGWAGSIDVFADNKTYDTAGGGVTIGGGGGYTVNGGETETGLIPLGNISQGLGC